MGAETHPSSVELLRGRHRRAFSHRRSSKAIRYAYKKGQRSGTHFARTRRRVRLTSETRGLITGKTCQWPRSTEQRGDCPTRPMSEPPAGRLLATGWGNFPEAWGWQLRRGNCPMASQRAPSRQVGRPPCGFKPPLRQGTILPLGRCHWSRWLVCTLAASHRAAAA